MPLQSPLAKLHTDSYEQLQHAIQYRRIVSSEGNVPCRPAACTIEAISADDNRSGRETSVNVIWSVFSDIRRNVQYTYSLLDLHLDRDSFCRLQFGRLNVFLFVTVVGIQSFDQGDQDEGEQGQVYRPDS